jgi:hypothetical protein
MGRKAEFSEAEWSAWAIGEKLAAEKRPMRMPQRLSQAEQTAFRERYGTKEEDMRNRTVVAEIKSLLGGNRLRSVIQNLVKH